MTDIRIIPTTGRGNCGGRCIIKAHVKDGQIIKITTDTKEEAGNHVPLIACARGLNYHKTYLSDDRLRTPLKRVGKRGEGQFIPISWKAAIDELTSEWIRIRDTYGPESRYVTYGTGNQGLMNGRDLTKRLLSLDGGFLDYYNSYSSACVRGVSSYIYGKNVFTGNPPWDWLNSSLIVLWGHNPSETVFDAETMYYLRKAKEKGIPIIGIDPRRNDTIKILEADWYPIRPATDSALADGIAYELYTTGRYDRHFIQACCIGFSKDTMPANSPENECVFSYLMGEKDGVPKTPEWAASITGLPAEKIRELATRFWEAKPLNILQGWGPQRNAYGEQATRAAIMLACLTGNVGIPGGSSGGPGDWVCHDTPAFPITPNPYPGKIPCYLWTEFVKKRHNLSISDNIDKDGQKKTELSDSVQHGLEGVEQYNSIKMMFCIAGNTLINQHGDINTTKKLLEDESLIEYIVVSDIFMTSSARYADLILPAPSFLEEENITMPWGWGNFLGYNNKVIEPLHECRTEYDWLKEVADRLGLKEAFTEGHETQEEWLCFLYEDFRKKEPELPNFEIFKEKGIYRYEHNPSVIPFENERRDPEHYPFRTPSGKIEIFSETLYNKKFSEPFPAIPRYMAPEEDVTPNKEYPLLLMGWHTKRRTHSVHDNNPAMEKRDLRAVFINPKDALCRNLSEGQEVRVYNSFGEMILPVHITEDIMEGVAAISQGGWYRPDENGIDRGGCLNTLTNLHPTPLAKGNAQHTNRAQISSL